MQVRQACDELTETKDKVGDMWGLFHLGRHCILPVSRGCVCILGGG